MSDILRRERAPLTPEAWAEVDEAVKRILKAQLSARTVVDFDGPHGLDFAVLNTGRLDIPKKQSKTDVPWGIRTVQPLIEVRIPFVLDQMELDTISRGCQDPDLGPAEQAAHKLALFEESAVYKGFAEGQVTGLIPAASQKAISLPHSPEDAPQAVGKAIERLSATGISGPWALVLGSKAYYPLMQAGKGGYPPRRIVKGLLEDGPILWSPALDGGVLLSTRGGDFQLVVGLDIAVGYATHDRSKVELYLTESFTFRVLEPAAAVELKAS